MSNTCIRTWACYFKLTYRQLLFINKRKIKSYKDGIAVLTLQPFMKGYLPMYQLRNFCCLNWLLLKSAKTPHLYVEYLARTLSAHIPTWGIPTSWTLDRWRDLDWLQPRPPKLWGWVGGARPPTPLECVTKTNQTMALSNVWTKECEAQRR